MKLFLFDVDGTLISTGGAGLRALSAAFHEMTGIADASESINPSGKTDPAIFRELFQLHLKRNMTAEDHLAISILYLKRLEKEMAANSKAKALAGVTNFLEYTKRRTDIAMGLGTGNLEAGARLKLGPLNLNPYFSFGGFGSDAEVRSEVLKVGLNRAEKITGRPIPPESVYVIGDTPLDIEAARQAGFKVVAVATGRTSIDELRASDPDFAYEDLAEGLKLFEEIDG